jgi:NTE family protein
MTEIDFETIDLSGLTPDKKLGLALSGGGFRASFFHIGVLARLAELDILKHVQVLSTVSGGSIIGAFYYLKLKDLYEGRRAKLVAQHGGVNRACYIALIHEIEQEFLDGVRENLRVRTFGNATSNARIWLSDVYSRSDRMADLYDEYFYRRFVTRPGQKEIMLQDLKIVPAVFNGNNSTVNNFSINDYDSSVKDYNKSAEHKIPVLTINATSLNTGNSWHFTDSLIGEAMPIYGRDLSVVLKFINLNGAYPPGAGTAGSSFASPLVDPARETKRQAKLQEIGLSHAVAASACVPGVFKPFPVHDLYRNSQDEEIVNQLVDGGVFDNQGIDALERAGCDFMICSDGSGQLEDELDPPARALPVINRSNSVLMSRVREQTLRDFQGSPNKIVLHLRQVCHTDLHGDPALPPIPGPAYRSDPKKKDGLVYRLSNLRTDLDAFSDIEANSLMYQGYHLACERFLTPVPPPRSDWLFLNIAPLIRTDPSLLLQHFRIGTQLWFKPFAFYPCLPYAVFAILIAITLAFLILISGWPLAYIIAPVGIGAFLYGLFLFLKKHFSHVPGLAIALQFLSDYRRRDDTLLFRILEWGPGLIVAGITGLSLKYINPWFLKIGKIG